MKYGVREFRFDAAAIQIPYRTDDVAGWRFEESEEPVSSGGVPVLVIENPYGYGVRVVAVVERPEIGKPKLLGIYREDLGLDR